MPVSGRSFRQQFQMMKDKREKKAKKKESKAPKSLSVAVKGTNNRTLSKESRLHPL